MPNKGHYHRAVISTDRHGHEKFYPSIQKAVADVGLKWPCQISTACVTGNRCAGRHWRYAEPRPQKPSPVCVGDRVEYRLTNLSEQDRGESKVFPGVVVYVHPAERFHTVEFTLPSGKKIRESFPGVMRRC